MITFFIICFFYYLIKGLIFGNKTPTIQPIDDKLPVEEWSETDEFLYTSMSLELEALERQQRHIEDSLHTGTKQVRKIKKGVVGLSDVPLTNSEESKLELDLNKLDKKIFVLQTDLLQLESKKKRLTVS